MRDNVVESPPYGDRSSTGVTPEGALDVRRIEFFGTWRGLGQRRTLNDLNQSPGPNGISLFTPHLRAGHSGPAGRDRDRDLAVPGRRRRTRISSGPCVQVASGGGTAIPQGGAVLVARGTAAPAPRSRSRPSGRTLTLRLIFRPEWTGVTNAVGGGPVLVRSGGPVFRAQEAFTLEPARAAQPAHRRRPARRRPRADGRHRRPPARLQRRDDELRARADDGAARRGHRLGLRRRRLVVAGVRRQAAQPPVRPRRRAAGLDRAPAHVLRRLLADAGAGGLAERRRLRGEAARALVQGRPALERDRDAASRPGAPSPSPRRWRASRGRIRSRSRPHRRIRPWSSPPRPPKGAGSSRSSATDDLGAHVDDDPALHRQQHARLREALAPHARRPGPRQADDRCRRDADARRAA